MNSYIAALIGALSGIMGFFIGWYLRSLQTRRDNAKRVRREIADRRYLKLLSQQENIGRRIRNYLDQLWGGHFTVVGYEEVYPAKTVFRINVFHFDDGERQRVLTVDVDMFDVDGGQISWSLAQETKTHFYQGAEEHVEKALAAMNEILLKVVA